MICRQLGGVERRRQRVAVAFFFAVQLWVLFLATTMGLVLQCMAAKVGVVTGKNLAQNCRGE